MVDFGSVYPDEEDIKLAVERSISVIQEELQNLRDINKRLMEGHSYIDADKCAEILHCKVSEIPSALPYYRASRVGNAGVLYKLSEVIDFIEERRIPKNK
jgi:hypothetical protein